MSQHQEVTDRVGASGYRQISGVVDGSVVTSLHPDGAISFQVAIGQEPGEGECIEIVLDGPQAQAVIEAWHRSSMDEATTTLPAACCQIGVQRRTR